MAKTAFPTATSPIPTDAEWRAIARNWLSTGVIRGVTSELAVYADSTGMQVKVPAGEAYVEGTRFASDAVETLPISTADATNPRVDLVVLRLDTVAGTVDFAVLTGTAAASPAVPTATQTTTRWELPLAQIAVAAAAATIAAGNVTDRRTYAQAGAYKARASDNLLVNGGLEVWQRGAGAFTANSAYAADRWQIVLGGTSTLSVSKDTTNVALGSGACAALTYTHNAVSSLSQKLEDYLQLRGHSVAFSARVRGSVASSARLRVTDGTTTWYSAYHTGGGAYETLSVVASIGAAATLVTVALDLGATGTYYLDNATLVTGSQPQDYQPLTPADDLARCERYYERHGELAGTGFPQLVIYAGTVDLYDSPISFAAHKGGTPTLTKAGTWTAVNCGQPAAYAPNNQGYSLGATSLAAGRVVIYPDSVDDYIAAEWNP